MIYINKTEFYKNGEIFIPKNSKLILRYKGQLCSELSATFDRTINLLNKQYITAAQDNEYTLNILCKNVEKFFDDNFISYKNYKRIKSINEIINN